MMRCRHIAFPFTLVILFAINYCADFTNAKKQTEYSLKSGKGEIEAQERGKGKIGGVENRDNKKGGWNKKVESRCDKGRARRRFLGKRSNTIKSKKDNIPKEILNSSNDLPPPAQIQSENESLDDPCKEVKTKKNKKKSVDRVQSKNTVTFSPSRVRSSSSMDRNRVVNNKQKSAIAKKKSATFSPAPNFAYPQGKIAPPKNNKKKEVGGVRPKNPLERIENKKKKSMKVKNVTKTQTASSNDTVTFFPDRAPSSSPDFRHQWISSSPSATPTNRKSISTFFPSNIPSGTSTLSPFPNPSTAPSNVPSKISSPIPTSSPLDIPTNTPSSIPTKLPSESPLANPTNAPSNFPSNSPSSVPSHAPTSSIPTKLPSESPLANPTNAPSNFPSNSPSSVPTYAPSYDCASSEGRLRETVRIVESISGTVTSGSPQDKALLWILNEDASLPNACDGPKDITQRYSLAVLYFSTIGDNWTTNDGWLGSADECQTWYGVSCDFADNVIQILLDNNNISGMLPGELGALHTITFIDFYNNSIEGTIPSQISSLKKLHTLDIEQNHFTGILFSEDLFSLKGSLINLLVSGNRFTGTIPSMISEFSTLENFWIAENYFTGEIPSDISDMIGLVNLFLYDNEFTGSIPNDIGNLINMEWLDISINRNLSGNIPTSIGNLVKLKHLVLYETKVFGSIPTSIGGLENIQNIFLAENKLSGSIPNEISNLSMLEYLTLHGNALTGPIPDLSGSREIFLSLSNNELSGTIPQFLFETTSLEILYLSNNNLSGPIPSWDNDNSYLRDIWLDGNNLNGTIPDLSSDALPFITEIMIFDNRLSGPVPDGICSYRETKSDQFVSLEVDCKSFSGGQAQNPCKMGCCTNCFAGKSSFGSHV